MTKEKLKKLYLELLQNGGFTAKKDFSTPTNLKYMVSESGFEVKTALSDLAFRDFLSYMNVFRQLAQQQNAFIGCWVDDGVVYFDLSDSYEDKETALKVAKQNKQLAIYDAVKEEVIKV